MLHIAKGIAVIMWLNNLIEYIDKYVKRSGSLWQYFRDELALTDAGAISDFFFF